jgi:hypothetical protein
MFIGCVATQPKSQAIKVSIVPAMIQPITTAAENKVFGSGSFILIVVLIIRFSHRPD